MLEHLSHIRKALDYYNLIKEGEYAVFAFEAFGRLPMPRYQPDSAIIGPKKNALGLDACSSALVAYNTCEAFMVGLSKDDCVRGDRRAILAAGSLFRFYCKRFITENFDKATIEASAKEVGIPEVASKLKSLVPSVQGYSAGAALPTIESAVKTAKS